MPRFEPHPQYPADFDAAFLCLLQVWIGFGLLSLIGLPFADWHNHTIGWLPYWLLVAPLVSLALLRRQRIAAALSAISTVLVVRGRRRRKPAAYRRATRRAAVASPRTRTMVRPTAALILP